MHVRLDNQYKTGADRGNILEQPMLFECIGICVLSPGHESEMKGYPVYVLIIKYLSQSFCLNSATVYIRLDGLAVEFFFFFWGGDFLKTF